MIRHLRGAIAISLLVLGCASFAAAQAESLPLGTWPGTVRNPTAGPRNQQARPASLSVKKAADPHVRWRGGSGELLIVALTLQQQTFEVGSVEYSDARLALSFTHPERGEPMNCVLLRQKDGSYEGDCTGAMTRRVMLTPPVPESNPPAPAKP